MQTTVPNRYNVIFKHHQDSRSNYKRLEWEKKSTKKVNFSAKKRREIQPSDRTRKEEEKERKSKGDKIATKGKNENDT